MEFESEMLKFTKQSLDFQSNMLENIDNLDKKTISAMIFMKEQELSILKKKLNQIEHYNRNELNKINEERKRTAQEIKNQTRENQIKSEMEMIGSIPECEMEDSNILPNIISARIKTVLPNGEIEYDDDIFENKVTHISQTDLSIDDVKFGDILDFTGYRHYSWLYVGKNGSLETCNYDTGYSDVIEAGSTVPANITRYLKDPWKKYSSIECIQSYELTYDSKIVKSYKNVPKDCLYNYLNDPYESGEWELCATNKYGEEQIIKRVNN